MRPSSMMRSIGAGRGCDTSSHTGGGEEAGEQPDGVRAGGLETCLRSHVIKEECCKIAETIDGVLSSGQSDLKAPVRFTFLSSRDIQDESRFPKLLLTFIASLESEHDPTEWEWMYGEQPTQAIVFSASCAEANGSGDSRILAVAMFHTSVVHDVVLPKLTPHIILHRDVQLKRVVATNIKSSFCSSHIDALFIDKQLHRQKIGSDLFRLVMRSLRTASPADPFSVRVANSNEVGLLFYKAHGFTEFPEVEVASTGTHTHTMFVKVLNSLDIAPDDPGSVARPPSTVKRKTRETTPGDLLQALTNKQRKKSLLCIKAMVLFTPRPYTTMVIKINHPLSFLKVEKYVSQEI